MRKDKRFSIPGITAMLGRLPIKWKLTSVIVAVASIVLIINNIIFYAYESWVYSYYLEKRMSTLAQMTGNNSKPSLRFNDREDGVEILSSLRFDPAIISALLFDADGGLLAEYVQTGSDLSVPIVKLDRNYFNVTPTEAEIVYMVMGDKKEKLGTLLIRSNLNEKHERSRFRILMASALFFLSTALAVPLGIWFQSFFTTPIFSLLRVMRRVSSEKNYQLRASTGFSDEFGTLAGGFNRMLSQIEKHRKNQEKYARELQDINSELDNFAYVVSHDLKSPLVTTQGFATMLESHIRSGNEDKAFDAIGRIQRATKHMGNLIDDLLKLSRIGRKHLELQTVDLQEVLEDVKLSLESQLIAAEVKLELPSIAPKIYSQKTLVSQVVENLIGNAVKYGCPEPGMPITVCFEEDEKEVRMSVTDNGPGIAPDYHQTVYALFNRLDTSKSGTGIGLAVVAKVMRFLGGRTWVDSDLGKGATFWVAFPRESEEHLKNREN